MARLVAGVDSSTQSCTVEIRDADTGALHGTGRAPHPPTFPPVSEQHPNDWWRAFTAAFAAACVDAEVSALDIAAISIGAQCHGLVLLDSQDAVLRPAKLWNDTTSAGQATAMVARLGRENWVTQIGLTPTAALTVTKLAWVADNEPELLARIGGVLVPHDFPHLILSDKSLRLIPRSGVTPSWLLAALRSRPARTQIEVLATGTKESMRNISQAKLRRVEVPVPRTSI